MTEREALEQKLKEAHERWKRGPMYKHLRELAEQAKGHEIEVLRNLKFDVPLSEEIIRERRGE